jgi:uncharacterized protein YbjT (DUF2867 family)
MPTVLLTGATGFVGSRLHGPLESAGFLVRSVSRRPEAARQRQPTWNWAHGDVSDPSTMRQAMEGCAVACYLIHGMEGAPRGWAEAEWGHAAGFAEMAGQAGLQRLVYLGGMAPRGEPSEHLRARLETGRALRSGRVPCLELRASMIIGHGSASWRMVRDLSVRLPVMVLPAWLKHLTEPVAVDDVIAALVKAASLEFRESRVEDLPGPEVLSAREILVRTAALVGHRPLIAEVPFVTPRLSSHWIRLVSGVDYRLARELVAGLTSDILAERHDFWERAGLAPPMSFKAAAQRALAEDEAVESRPVRGFERVIGRISRRTT